MFNTDSEDDGYKIDPKSKHRPRSRKKKSKSPRSNYRRNHAVPVGPVQCSGPVPATVPPAPPNQPNPTLVQPVQLSGSVPPGFPTAPPYRSFSAVVPPVRFSGPVPATLAGSAPTQVQLPPYSPLYPSMPPGSRMAPWQNKNPFVLYSLTNRIKKCAGCPFEFRDPNGPYFLVVVLQHKERDFYTKDGRFHMSSDQNRYYHCKLACIKPRHPYFSSSLVRLEPGLTLSDFQSFACAEIRPRNLGEAKLSEKQRETL